MEVTNWLLESVIDNDQGCLEDQRKQDKITGDLNSPLTGTSARSDL